MKLLPSIARLLVLGSLLGSAAVAQELVESTELPEAIRVLDTAPSKSLLPCFIQFDGNPQLDFLFRYTAGFLVYCRLGEKLRAGTRLVAFVRITPSSGKPTIMTEQFDIPHVRQHDSAGFYAPPSELEASMSGGFALGSGRYSAEVVLVDEQGRTCRKRKKLKPGRERGDRNVPVALERGAVAPLVDARWNGSLATNGPRLTVLLNAHGALSSANLHALDRIILLESLTTMLNHIPCKSVKLIAFDLESQQKIFSQDTFDADGFVGLERALERIQFASIPYQALRKGGWTRFLVDLAQRESASKESPDDVVFLGPWGSHEWEKLPRELARKVEVSNAHFFYFALFPNVGGGPDGLERLTRDLHGSVFAIRSPETLEQAIRKTVSLTAGPLN
jgi:hypothetical protein